ncbi:MAG TPA: 30S ribosomal protein S7 [Dehalococcoidia bacterium]|nr:30S ribosomal protein S7 [Dehalococcoidia bacterium]HLB29644.1 30S ribosomal protein S7 [Dehalococcoidia bacterium]
MPRRKGRFLRRATPPDPKYQSALVSRLVNKIMWDGKKSVAESVVYKAMDMVEAQTRRSPLEVVEQAVRNATPLLEVRPRRVGGATYQVPIEVRPERALSLALRWLVAATRNRKGRPMFERLAAELMDAVNNHGAAVKRREDLHRMAESNRAFVHYRW